MNDPSDQPAVQLDGSSDLVGEVDMDWLRTRLAAAAARIQPPVRRVAVRIVDDREMTRLHERHLGKAHTTDVLTFPASQPGEPIEADIAVCIDEAARRALELGHPIERELLLYCLHGLLHCAGHDDHDEQGHAAMHAEEDRILEAIGVGATFNAARSDDLRAIHQREATAQP